MKNKQLYYLGWLIIMAVAFWGGRLTAPEKIKVKKIPGVNRVVYKLDGIPMNAIIAYLGVQGLEILPKNEAEKIKYNKHSYWQEGYKAGVQKGCR